MYLIEEGSVINYLYRLTLDTPSMKTKIIL